MRLGFGPEAHRNQAVAALGESLEWMQKAVARGMACHDRMIFVDRAFYFLSMAHTHLNSMVGKWEQTENDAAIIKQYGALRRSLRDIYDEFDQQCVK